MVASNKPLLPKSVKSTPPFKVSARPPLKVLLNPLAWILWLLDFLVWALTVVGPMRCFLGCCKRRGGVQAASGCWRDANCKHEIMTMLPKMGTKSVVDNDTVYNLMINAFSNYADKPATGTRKYLGTHQEDGMKFPLQKFGETHWRTYAEFGVRVKRFGSGLSQLGLRPPPDGQSAEEFEEASGPHTLIIYEDTCEAWMTACMGAFMQSVAVATSYSTLGISSVGEAVNETGATVILCNIKDVGKVATYCSERCPSLTTIIYTFNNSTESKPKGALHSNIKVLSFEDVIQLGSPALGIPPTGENVAVIMYTSGSTGKPKGVVIQHKNFAASVGALGQKFQDFGLRAGSETYLAYLPAAHILELVAETSTLALGSAVGYADPKTISSKGAIRQCPDGSLNGKPVYPYPPGAIQEFRPTTMAAVPKIWDILKKGVEEVVGKGSPLKQLLFQIAYTGRYWAVSQGRSSPVFEKVVFKTLTQMLGGRLRIGVSGGGPISADVQEFIRIAFVMPLLQGYALTETTCAGCVQTVNDTRNGNVGPPLASVEIKLRSCVKNGGEAEVMDRERKPYLETDKYHYGKPCLGRGEVMIRGPSISHGYFKQPSKTAEVYDKDGWFYSGDVGLFTPDGTLQIVDRVKNLVKLKGGEYIAIEAMEKEYSTSVYVNGVNGGILCYGDGDMDRPVALVQANEGEITKWAEQQGIAFSSFDELCKHPAAEKLVLDSLVAAGKAGGLGANEILCAIALIPGTGPMAGEPTPASPWTAENQGLTASNKLNRQPIQMSCELLMIPLKEQGIR